MREAQVNLAIRWFIGYALHEALPDHSSLTRIRQRWGEDVFRRVFVRVVQQCRLAGLVSTETVRIDASLIRANVSMDARGRAPSRCGGEGQ
ncbi:MAG: transposase [Rhodobacteraceae bacterium]|nr:transposase [Paracoccaceae bacterium]